MAAVGSGGASDAHVNGHDPEIAIGSRQPSDTERVETAALRREYEFSSKDDPQPGHEWILQSLLRTSKDLDVVFGATYRRLDVQSTLVDVPRVEASWLRHQIKPAAPEWVQLLYRSNGAFSTGLDLSALARKWKKIKNKRKGEDEIKFPLLYSKYFILPYEFKGYAKHPVNVLETDPEIRGSGSLDGAGQEAAVPQIEKSHRCIGPSTVMVLDSQGPIICHPDDSDPDSTLTNYVFLSWYTGHFPEEDLPELENMGEQIARDLGADAYWCSSSCLSTDTTDRKVKYASEVYKMSDIVRSAQSVAIVLPAEARTSDDRFQALLEEWGSRVWTLPEVLLSQNDKVRIYIAGGQGTSVHSEEMSKYELAIKAWSKDAPSVRQLIDHFRGNLLLSRLELSFIALRCLRHRQQTYTFKGDLSYALMGLHRLRPPINIDDSAFTAFARLSMMGDSDRLMERALCMQTPESEASSWLSLVDDFQSQLWHINPECQIAAIDEDDTIIIDGAYGTSIAWDGFPECLSYSPRAEALFYELRYATMCFVICVVVILVGIAMLAGSEQPQQSFSYLDDTSSTRNAYLVSFGGVFIATGAIVGLPALYVLCSYPDRIRRKLKKDPPRRTPSLHGVEGYMPLHELEKIMFNKVRNILKWDPHGSTLSTHEKVRVHMKQNKEREIFECRGTDPYLTHKELIDGANRSDGGLKVFMLVNTFTFTVTLFQARTPPCAALICGSEGGMKRVVLCSFDWTRETLYREAVIRMETVMVDFMFRVGRFKFGFRRPRPAGVEAQNGSAAPVAPSIEDGEASPDTSQDAEGEKANLPGRPYACDMTG